jgi:hypothetical protein
MPRNTWLYASLEIYAFEYSYQKPGFGDGLLIRFCAFASKHVVSLEFYAFEYSYQKLGFGDGLLIRFFSFVTA